MCLYSKIIKNKKYTATKKNNGIIPEIKDTRVLYVPVGCGKCMECKKKKAREWSVRLQEEIRINKNAEYVTLTFSNEQINYIIEGKDTEGKQITEPLKITGYELDNTIATIATRRFLERWRKKYGKSVKHWLVTELGHNGTENIHLHGLIWTNEKKEIEKIWKYGYVWIGEWVNEQTINYIVKYINKTDKQHKEYKSTILGSKGIGKNYINRIDSKNNKYNEKGETKEYYKTRQGIKLNLPIYYRNKIYTDEEKEKLWIEKLNKQERWINGIKIDISKGEKNYYKILKEEQKKNKRLGYGGRTTWKVKEYENERRKILQNERTKKYKTIEEKEKIEEKINEIKPATWKEAF